VLTIVHVYASTNDDMKQITSIKKLIRYEGTRTTLRSMSETEDSGIRWEGRSIWRDRCEELGGRVGEAES
jgi:hypothetical protein